MRRRQRWRMDELTDDDGEQLALTLGPLYHVLVDDRVSGPLTGRPARTYRSPPPAPSRPPATHLVDRSEAGLKPAARGAQV